MLQAKWFFFLCLVLFSCSDVGYTPPENAIDAGRQFLDAAYKGNFKRANDLIVQDDTNKKLLNDLFETPYHQKNSADREKLSQASIQVLNIKNNSQDSSTTIHFSNAYQSNPAYLKIIKQNGEWLVDLEASFSTEKP